ncbi:MULTISPECIES: rhodanese-like domain-containing protein [Ornithinibacillus]|uniref:rhodanese-like domain-containing protein n=1 Tax=Ornithinibacillus TaxID=484508 RepID=UPI00064D9ABE|nr:rhodanese-like domain-containing protein [Ornithinibacillus contaminans]
MKEITAKELEQKLVSGEKLNIIDVREDVEVATGKIPGAKHIPLGHISDRLEEFDKNEHYYMVCRSGGRSGNACQFLTQNSFNVTNMLGGMLAWEGELE